MCYRYAGVLVVNIIASACGAALQNDLIVEFKPVCKDQEVWLSATIRNAGSQQVRIENGVLPWEYDAVGTSFQAEGSGTKLSRNPAAPLIGRVGPIHLQPNQQLSGETPIAFMFPEIAELIGTQPITIHWAYWTKPQADDAERIKGTVVLSQNPCS